MERIKFTPKYVVIGVMMLVVADALVMLFGAVLIEKKVLSLDAINIWGLSSIVVSSIIASMFCCTRSGVPMNAYGVIGFCFLLLVLLPMATCNTGISPATAVKELTALICGAFIGNFFGMSRHNKLRKKVKKKRSYTK